MEILINLSLVLMLLIAVHTVLSHLIGWAIRAAVKAQHSGYLIILVLLFIIEFGAVLYLVHITLPTK